MTFPVHPRWPRTYESRDGEPRCGPRRRAGPRLSGLPGGHRFRPSGVGNVNINPSGEPIFEIPRALTVANNDESSVGHGISSGLGQA